ncbi:WAT1-related protein At4g28040-like isoform X2 [Dioscorea cayenensis subsp. rotundata]|uniref:WAT1-related protein n=1 Tax=Dioscorea cayennensis subsp. rotundata TaxID=55577 RepID=A0AB40BRA3_DIOCR|nr:WAT1-related protein At4g28040-like isoform X2 [Dioscorea cayenensis subsp. rotundata]
MRQCSYDGGKAILAMVMVQSIYAAITILTKQALREGFNVMVFVAYKQGLAFLILFTASILLNRGKINHLALGVKGFSWVFVAAIFCTTITQFCYYQGLNLTSSSMATAMLNLIPGVTFLISLLFGLEKLKLRSLRSMAKIFGTLICIAGAMCMALYKGSPILQSSKQNFMLGCILLFANIIGWSSWLILQDIICRHYLDPLSVTVWGIFGTTVTYYLQAWIIAARGPLFSAVFNPLTTVITTTFTFLLLHENLYVGSLVGAIAVIVGLYIVLWGKGADYGTKTKLDQKDDSIEEADVQSDLHEPLVSSTRGVDV